MVSNVNNYLSNTGVLRALELNQRGSNMPSKDIDYQLSKNHASIL